MKTQGLGNLQGWAPGVFSSQLSTLSLQQFGPYSQPPPPSLASALVNGHSLCLPARLQSCFKVGSSVCSAPRPQ